MNNNFYYATLLKKKFEKNYGKDVTESVHKTIGMQIRTMKTTTRQTLYLHVVLKAFIFSTIFI